MLNKKRIISFLIILCMAVGTPKIPAVASQPGEQEMKVPILLQGQEDTDTMTTGDAEEHYGYHDIGYTAPSYADSNIIPPNYRSNIPAKYDSRTQNYITEVKNQGSYGTCWAFAAIGAAETNFIKGGGDSLSLDLSELHLAYFFYNRGTDPLGGTKGDKVEPIKDNFLESGGNTLFTAMALANWQGAAEESIAPYDLAATTLTGGLLPELAYDDYIHLQNTRWINMQDTNIIKECIVEYGAGVVSYYDSDPYRSPDGKSYYNDINTTTNHAITVIGWDDGYDRNLFNKVPSSDGAWLIKNSWGTNARDGGYFWISYEDTSIKDGTAYFFGYEPADNYDNNYQYDGTYGNSSTYYKGQKEVYEANIFTAYGKETLGAVSFYVNKLNVTYEIQIYKNIQNTANPTSGEKVFASGQTGVADYCGYYTIPLKEKVELEEGEEFSVVIKLQSPQGEVDSPGILVDKSYTNGDWIRFETQQEPGQSFLSSNGMNWTDLSTKGQTARIKAFTKNTGIKYVLDGGTNHNDNPPKIPENGKVTLKEPKREGYEFEGWYRDAAYSEKVTEILAGTGKRLILYAKWSAPITYSVTFQLNGGNDTDWEPITYTVESEIIELSSPARHGYEFEGWYTDLGLGKKISSIGKGTTGDITLFAKWAPRAYTILYKLGGGKNHNDNPSSYTIESGDISLHEPVRTGYAFEGWYKDSGGSEAITVIGNGTTGDIMLYAKWSLETYTVSYELGDGINHPDNPSEYTVETEAHLKNPTKTGYIFKGWYIAQDPENAITMLADGKAGNLTLHAEWEAVPEGFVIEDGIVVAYTGRDTEISIPEGVTGIKGGVFGSYTDLESVTLPESLMSIGTRAFYNCSNLEAIVLPQNLIDIGEEAFLNCTELKTIEILGDVESIGENAFPNSKDIIIWGKAGSSAEKYAERKNIVFRILGIYKISYKWNGGMDNGEHPSEYETGKGTVLYAPQRMGYNFLGWFNENNNEKLTAIEKGRKEDLVLYAGWGIIHYSITYHLNSGINNAGNPGSYTIEREKIVLQNPARNGYTFEGWYTDSNFKKGITAIPKGSTGDLIFYAKWVKNEEKKISCKVAFRSNGGTKPNKSSITVTKGKKYGKLPTVVRKGYTFKGWYTKAKGGTKINSNSKVSITSNQTLYAQWSRVSKPAKVKISNLKNNKSKQMAVVIKRVSGAAGYQIMYSTKQNFRSSRTTTTASLKKTVKGLIKGRTYYVKVRAYKLDSAKSKVYGNYGNVRKVKIN